MTNIRKHIPQRTCIGCRKVRAKRELIRLVRTPDGSIEVDTTGKKAGRGAYLCPECLETGLKGNRLEHALHAKLTADGRRQLLIAVEGIGQKAVKRVSAT